MELTRKKINEYKELIEGLDGYYVITSEIEDNLLKNPDISIESCKSLIEGLCKKALESVSDKYNTDKQLRSSCDDKMSLLIKTTFEEVYASSIERDLHESLYGIIKNKVRTQKIIESSKLSFLKDGKKAIDKIIAIRHTRGDISHGRIYPKSIESEIHLAQSIKAITDGICSFMIHELAIQYKIKLELSGRLIYADQFEYNDWLDDQNDKLTTKIDFSRLLYVNNYEKYEEIFYSEYSDSFEALGEEEITEDIVVVPKEELKDNDSTGDEPKVIVEVENDTIKALVNDFYEETFWTEEKELSLGIFVVDEKLILDKTKEVIEEYLFKEKKPLPDMVANTLIQKPNLKDRKEIVNELTIKIVTFSDDLKK